MAWCARVGCVLLAPCLVAARPMARSSNEWSRTRRALTGYVLDDISIKTAVASWLNNRSSAEATYGHISTWETGGVKNMDCLFSAVPSQRNRAFCEENICDPKYRCGDHYNSAALYFNDDITAWDTSSVTSMNSMFQSARLFNKRLGDWRVDKVTSMNRMFSNAKRLNRDLGWCVTANVHRAFAGTKCESTSCGVETGAFGTCDEGIQAVFIILIVWACLVALYCLIYWYKADVEQSGAEQANKAFIGGLSVILVFLPIFILLFLCIFSFCSGGF